MLRRYWSSLPGDGLGWSAGPDATLGRLRRRAARDWAGRWHWPIPWLIRLVDRGGWPIAAALRTLVFARALGLAPGAGWRVFCDCLMSGSDPLDAHVWRSLHGGRHPLPPRSAAQVLVRLGDPRAHDLLADKLATQWHLEARGLAFPMLDRVSPRGTVPDLAELARAAQGAGLFVKPRRGHGGRDSFALTRSGDRWHIDGRPVASEELRQRWTRAVASDDLLVQHRVMAAAELADLAADGRAPVLRLATARRRDGAVFVHSALLGISVPGRDPRHFLEGTIYVPVIADTGALARGRRLARPSVRLDRVEETGARIAGRVLPFYAQTVALARRAMAALPPLPLVHWDWLLSDDGPVLLEGNSAANWNLACLPGLEGLEAMPLSSLLVEWEWP